MSARILYVEDDEQLSFVTKDNLELAGYDITHCAEGDTALKHIKRDEYDLAILDVMLPEIDGFTLAEEIRKRNKEVPILFLTAKSLNEDKIHGLQLGGDDYIVKPFSIEELLLKVKIFLRRSNFNVKPKQTTYQFGGFEFRYKDLTLHYGGKTQQLTQKEADLLRMLVENKNEILKRSKILEKLWGEDDYFLGRSMDVFISRLRKYLKKSDQVEIENIHGVGFRLNID